MKTRRGLFIAAAVAAALVAAGLFARWWPWRVQESAHLRALRAEHKSLHQQFEGYLKAEPLLAESLGERDVVVAINTPYLGKVIQEVARRYLDRVELDLAPHIRIQESGEITKKTIVGTMTLGEWNVDLTIGRLQGVLGAQTPDLKVSGDNKVFVVVPVRVASAHGEGVARFSWDSKSVANLVCKDFILEERLEATAFPDQYRVRGAFAFSQQGDHVLAAPEFPREKYRVRVDLTPASWQKVEAALRSQDTAGRCGIAIDPPAVLEKLRDLANTGFEFKLPLSLFRPVTMPANYRSQVDVQGTRVDVAVEPRVLRLTPRFLWYAATLNARILATPAPASAGARPTQGAP